MKALRRRILDARKATGVEQHVIERDYAQSYVLLGFGDSAELRETLVFKGGTALKKIHFEQYRFSEDLDFSTVDGPKSADLESHVRSAIARAQQAAREIAPLVFFVERYEEKDPHPGGQETFTVRIQFPWHRQPMIKLKIEVTHDEPVLLAATHRQVCHGYDEALTTTVRTYSLEEICAEKLRATQQTLAKLVERGWTRPRARDYYDLWHLVRQPAGRIDWAAVSSVLPSKCELRQVAITSIDDIFEPRLLEEVRGAWEASLRPFVPDLPELDPVLEELRRRLEQLLRFDRVAGPHDETTPPPTSTK